MACSPVYHCHYPRVLGHFSGWRGAGRLLEGIDLGTNEPLGRLVWRSFLSFASTFAFGDVVIRLLFTLHNGNQERKMKKQEEEAGERGEFSSNISIRSVIGVVLGRRGELPRNDTLYSNVGVFDFWEWRMRACVRACLPVFFSTVTFAAAYYISF